MVLQRRRARTSLVAFTEFSFNRYRVAPHHRRIAEALEAVERGDIGRLAIFVPPRHGKSELASRRFPAWFMGRNPEMQFISASYNSELAGDFGREVRNIVASPEFRAVFPAVSLAADSRAQDRWNTAQGGSYVAAGVNTAITGRGADILSIDDPVKDRAEADSQLQRDRTWAWYTSTAYTRLMPGGRITICQTRWHEDDLAGRLLAAQAKGGDQWHVLELPALDDAGEALWPEAYPVEALERIRAAIGSRDWSALYQGRPAPDTGDYFRREWLRPVNTLPPLASLRVYGASDYAVTADGGDWTVHVVVGMDPDGRLWLLDLWRGQASSEVWVDAFCDLVRQWQPIGWAEEGGQIRAGVGPFLERRLRERGAYIGRKQFPTRGDKAVRAQSIRGRMAMDGLHYRADAAWRSDMESELMAFPAGKHDDQVDALGLVGQLLNLMEAGRVPETTRPQPPPGAVTGDMLVERHGRGGRI
jgi:predicted phage terminase large subunit-like protein